MTSRAAIGVECMLPVMLTQARCCRCTVFRLTLICDAFFRHSKAALVKKEYTLRGLKSNWKDILQATYYNFSE
jgi:hypothetical protein